MNYRLLRPLIYCCLSITPVALATEQSNLQQDQHQTDTQTHQRQEFSINATPLQTKHVGPEQINGEQTQGAGPEQINDDGNATNNNHYQQQLDYLIEAHTPEHVAALEIKMQNLQGTIELLQHQITLLKRQINHLAGNKKKNKTAQEQDKALLQYQGAFDLLNNQENKQAEQAFKQIIQEDAKGAYAAEAHYWLGEIYLTQQQLQQADEQFQQIIDEFPQHHKVADALYKRALIGIENKQYEQSMTWLKQIITDFPHSTAARLATLKISALTRIPS